MKIAIDAMSGDLGSAPIVSATKQFSKKHPDVDIYITGKQEELQELTDTNIHIIDARDIVTMEDSPLQVRRKKESSMVKALMMAKNNEVDGVISCGSTGAFYLASMLFVKRIEGVEKSCLMASMPTQSGKATYLMDVGANANNTAKQLEEFALMGSIYVKNVVGINEPQVALLNIGTEDHKGDDVHKEAYQLLKDNESINFIGNIEGKDILKGDVDVIITDGFTGNIALKSIEGTASILMSEIKNAMLSSTKGKIGALLAKDSLYSLKDKFDYKSVGGALMMGFSKAIVKAHGRSDDTAFLSALELLYTMINTGVVDKMKEGLS